MTNSINEIMAAKKQAALQAVKSALWDGKTEQAIETALANSISENEIGKLQAEIESIQATIETGNAVNIAQLEKEVAAAEKEATVSHAALEKAQAQHDAVSSRAYEARQALENGKQSVYLAAATFEGGQVPLSIKASETVAACMKKERDLAATSSRRVSLQGQVRKLSEKIEDIRRRLAGGLTSLYTDGSHSKDLAKLEKEITQIETEKAKVLQELSTLL